MTRSRVLVALALTNVSLIRFAAPHAPSLAGKWDYELEHLALESKSGTVVCSIHADTITLRQSGAALGGFARGGMLTCDSAPAKPVTPTAVDSGIVHGDTVSFALGPNEHHGVVKGDLIEGTMTMLAGGMHGSGSFRMTRIK